MKKDICLSQHGVTQKSGNEIKKFFNIAVLGASEVELHFIKNCLKSLQFEAVLTTVNKNDSGIKELSSDIDLTIYCQTEGASAIDHVSVFLNKTLLITSYYEQKLLLSSFKKGVDHVLFRPLRRAEFLIAVRNLLFFSTKYKDAGLTETAILSFLKEIVKSGSEIINPFPSPLKPTGHFYPDVLRILGELENEEEYLNALAEKGLFIKKIKNRVRLCSLCLSYQVNYREICPVCSSIDISKKQMIHHFHCGHVDSLDNFRKSTDLVCPKCEQTLRHIGIDYEKPSEYFKCRDCSSITPEPTVELECLVCGQICSPDKTVEKNIYAYELTDLAWEAVRNDKIKGIDIASILYDRHTNLYNKQYFEMELNRELIRMKRYKSIFTFILARIEKIDDIMKSHSDKVAWYVDSIFNALSTGLRELDTTCVWDSKILGIILSGTGTEGTKIVVERIVKNIEAMEYLYDIGKPEVTFSIISGEGFNGSVQELTALAVKGLGND